MTKLSPIRLRKALTDKRLLRELHALLWSPPFLNEGRRDEGWHCREHSLIVAAIGALMGYRAALAWGSVALIGQTPSAPGPLYVSPHSWAMFEGAGFYDLSLNLSAGTGPGWKAWPATVLAGKGFYPGDRVEFAYFVADRQQSFQSAVQSAMEKAARQPAFHAAYYHGDTAADLVQDYVANSASYINSPLTDQLRLLSKYDSTIYLKAVRHCWDLLNRRTRSIADLPRLEAWDHIARKYDGALDWLVATSNLPMGGATS